MDSKKIQALLTVRETENLTRAAEALSYTQSGMTHMMQALERELGLALLQRGRSGVKLTEEAEALVPAMERFAAAADALERAVERCKGSSRRRLRVGAYSSMAQHWLPEIVQRFRADEPEAEVSIRMGSVTELLGLLKAGEVDCAFVSYLASGMTEALDWLPLHNDELVAILPESYPVKGALFGVRGFAGKDFLMPGDDFELDILPMLAANRVQPVVRYTNMNDPTILSMVEHGLGVSVLSELVIQGRHDRVLALPLTPPAYRELGVATRADSRGQKLLTRFVDMARSTVMGIYNAGAL